MGKRYFIVVNHRNFLCIELQFFFMILIFELNLILNPEDDDDIDDLG